MRSCWRNAAGVAGAAIRGLSPEGKELFRRMTAGDLADEFQAALDADADADPLLGPTDDKAD